MVTYGKFEEHAKLRCSTCCEPTSEAGRHIRTGLFTCQTKVRQR